MYLMCMFVCEDGRCRRATEPAYYRSLSC